MQKTGAHETVANHKILMIPSHEVAGHTDTWECVPVMHIDGTPWKGGTSEGNAFVHWSLDKQRVMPGPRRGQLFVADCRDAGTQFLDAPIGGSVDVIQLNSLELPDLNVGLEVLEAPEGWAVNQTDSLSSETIGFDHVPTRFALLLAGDAVLGPVDVIRYDRTENTGRVKLARATTLGGGIFSIPEGTFKDTCGKFLRTFLLPPFNGLPPIIYHFLLARGWKEFKKIARPMIGRQSQPPPPVKVTRALNLGEQELLKRAARNTLSRSKRKQFSDLLDELTSKSELDRSPDMTKLLEAARAAVLGEETRDEASITFLLSALKSAGVLTVERLTRAGVDTEAAGGRDGQPGRTEGAPSVQDDDLKAREARLVTAQEELEAARRTVAAERALIVSERQEALDCIRKAAALLNDPSGKAHSWFIALNQLLQRTDGGRVPGSPGREVDGCEVSSSFALPAYILAPRQSGGASSETEFFARFCTLVESSGFSYSERDLKSYHLSVKCGSLTVLAGPSGIGKTSLALLYARALSGSDFDGSRHELLVVNVNPSWMEVRDLIGHTNTIAGRFCPAENGLYEFLICAQEEYARHGDLSPLYLVCLDEMNLAQVEHYFGEFLQLLEMPLKKRVLNCFNRDTVSSSSQYASWWKVVLPPSLRFVGTVNCDETTRNLSDRLLDRANHISLGTGVVQPATRAAYDLASCSGPRITTREIQGWVRDERLPSDLLHLLNSISGPLDGLGVSVSPRVRHAMGRFVASAAPLLSPSEAFDVQVCQRLLSRVRHLVTPSQCDALDELRKSLAPSKVCRCPESLKLLEWIRRRETRPDWQAGDRG